MKKIILASASPRRAELLSLAGIDFEVVVSEADESLKAAGPAELVQALAARKAEAVSKNTGSLEADGKKRWILGADTIVACGSRILGKPKTREEAEEMIRLLQGRAHDVYTGVAIWEAGAGQIVIFYEKTKVMVRKMKQREIENYLDTREAFDKAGAYGIQGKFAVYVEEIQGDYYNVMGLPLCRLVQELDKNGYYDER